MGGSAGGALAAAVSNAGGLGLLGGGRGDIDWIERELAVLAQGTDRPFGVGLLSWSAPVSAVEAVLEHGPDAVMLSFGDPRALARPVREAGVKLIIQVTDSDEARRALDVGADVVVAQGTEAGGHGGGRGTLAFVPVVVDLAGDTPVLAAGGIADGRGVAAALALGAAGVLMGTRFQVATEAIVDPSVARAIIEHSGEDTERSRVIDIAREAPWPERYLARSLRNELIDRWRGREDELAVDTEAKADYRAAAARGDLAAIPVWASEAADLITARSPAAEIVASLVAEAEAALNKAAGAVVTT